VVEGTGVHKFRFWMMMVTTPHIRGTVPLARYGCCLVGCLTGVPSRWATAPNRVTALEALSGILVNDRMVPILVLFWRSFFGEVPPSATHFPNSEAERW
jgi:hypothetical protein